MSFTNLQNRLAKLGYTVSRMGNKYNVYRGESRMYTYSSLKELQQFAIRQMTEYLSRL